MSQQCQTCTLDPNHCAGNTKKATTYECNNYHINRETATKLLKQLQQPTDPDIEFPIDNRLFEWGSEPEITAWEEYDNYLETIKINQYKPQSKLSIYTQVIGSVIVKFFKTIYHITALLIWRLRK